LSCGSPMPRGEQIARPAEHETSLAGLRFLLRGPRSIVTMTSSRRAIAAAFVALPILWVGCTRTGNARKAHGPSTGISSRPTADLQDDDDLDALVAWFYGSVSNTNIKPSD